MFNKKDKKTDGAFIDQTKRNFADSAYKFVTSSSSKIWKKSKNLAKKVMKKLVKLYKIIEKIRYSVIFVVLLMDKNFLKI